MQFVVYSKLDAIFETKSITILESTRHSVVESKSGSIVITIHDSKRQAVYGTYSDADLVAIVDSQHTSIDGTQ